MTVKLESKNPKPANIESPKPARPGPLLAPFNSDTAHERQNAWAKFLGRKDFVETNSIGMKLVLIPPGEFLMGDDQSSDQVARMAGGSAKPEDFTDEHPQHRVRISQLFYFGIYEVTQSEWENMGTGSNPSGFSASGSGKDKVAGINTSRFPVEKVSWYNAIEYCNKLSRREGLASYYRITDLVRKDGWLKGHRGHCRRQWVPLAHRSGMGIRLPGGDKYSVSFLAPATTVKRQISTGIFPTDPPLTAPIWSELPPWGLMPPMPLAYLTCMEMSTNGALMDMMPTPIKEVTH